MAICSANKGNVHGFTAPAVHETYHYGQQGEADIARHSESQQHKANTKLLKANTKFMVLCQALSQ